MNSSETLIIKNRQVNSPHILSSGIVNAVLIGTSDTEFTEQQITALPIAIRHPRGSVRVFLQKEYRYGSSLDDGVGVVELYQKLVDNTGFHIFAVHNLKDGVSRNISIHWLAFGYEEYEAEAAASESAIAGGVYNRIEHFTGADLDVTKTKITLSNTPIEDASLILWTDRIPSFLGADFTLSGNTLTLFEALTGDESITVTYTSTT